MCTPIPKEVTMVPSPYMILENTFITMRNHWLTAPASAHRADASGR